MTLLTILRDTGGPATTPKSDTDTITFGESASVIADLTRTDSFSLGDAASLANAIGVSDTETFGDVASLANAVGASDTEAHSDAAALTGAVGVSDSEAHGEAPAIAGTLSAIDSETHGDAATLANALGVSDTETASDGAVIGTEDPKSGSDSGTVGDTGASISAATGVSEPMTLQEQADLAAQLIASEAETFSDSGAIQSVNLKPVWEEFRQEDGVEPPLTQSVRNEDVQALTNHARPSGAWRAWSDRSPFNKPIPDTRPTYDDGIRTSASIIDYLSTNATSGRPGTKIFNAGGSINDYDFPMYFAKSTDDLVTLVILSDPANGAPGNGHPNYGTSPLDGVQIRVPHDAKPSGTHTGGLPNTDSHMAVVQPNGDVYTMYRTQTGWTDGGDLNCRIAAVEPLTGDAISPAGDEGTTAARFANAPTVRFEELDAELIAHAWFATTYRTRGWVYPASGLGSETTDTHAPPMGARLRYVPDVATIDSQSWPEWVKVMMRAMHVYGLYIGDTGGATTDRLSLKLESDQVYRSFPADFPTPFSEDWAIANSVPNRFSGSTGRQVYEWIPANYGISISDFEVLMPDTADYGEVGGVSISAAVGVSEGLTQTESPTIAAAAAVADTLAHSENVLAGEFAEKNPTDSAVLAEVAALANALAANDSAAISQELITLSASLAATDPATMVEVAALSATLAASDGLSMGELAEILQTTSVSASDAVTLSEIAAMSAQHIVSDSLALSDLATVDLLTLKSALDNLVFSEAVEKLDAVPAPIIRLPLTASIVARAATASIVKRLAKAAVESAQAEAKNPDQKATAQLPVT